MLIGFCMLRTAVCDRSPSPPNYRMVLMRFVVLLRLEWFLRWDIAMPIMQPPAEVLMRVLAL